MKTYETSPRLPLSCLDLWQELFSKEQQVSFLQQFSWEQVHRNQALRNQRLQHRCPSPSNLQKPYPTRPPLLCLCLCLCPARTISEEWSQVFDEYLALFASLFLVRIYLILLFFRPGELSRNPISFKGGAAAN